VFYIRRDLLRWPRGTLYPQKLALTSPTRSGRSVGIVRSWTQATEFLFWFILWRDYVKDLGVCTDCKFYFHHHNADFLFSHAVKWLESIHSNIFFFSTVDSLPMLYFSFVRSKLECALLCEILLWLQVPVNLSTYKGNFLLFSTVDFSKHWATLWWCI
jgi:hypothetical protein